MKSLKDEFLEILSNYQGILHKVNLIYFRNVSDREDNFQGTEDGNVPVEGVYNIQTAFRNAGKTNLNCFIFDGHNHDLNYLDWPFEHKISEGLNSIFRTSELLMK